MLATLPIYFNQGSFLTNYFEKNMFKLRGELYY